MPFTVPSPGVFSSTISQAASILAVDGGRWPTRSSRSVRGFFFATSWPSSSRSELDASQGDGRTGFVSDLTGFGCDNSVPLGGLSVFGQEWTFSASDFGQMFAGSNVWHFWIHCLDKVYPQISMVYI